LIYALFSPDGKQVAAASFEGTGFVWDVATGQRLATLEGHTDTIMQLAFSPGGDRIATASLDGTTRLWHLPGSQGYVEGGQPLVLHGHQQGVWSVAFRPDGEQVATGGADNTVRLWNARTGNPEAVLPRYLGVEGADNWEINWEVGALESGGPIRIVCYVSYSPSGDWVAAANLDGSIDLYVADLNELLELLQVRAVRELTCQERVRFLYEDLDCSPQATPTP
jgi:WD40 repeat protein